MQYSGLHAIQIEVYVRNETGVTQYTLPRWPVYLDNGKPPPPPGSGAEILASMLNARGVISDSYYAHNGAGEKHAGPMALAREDFPWDPATGQDKAVSGVWQPKVFFEGNTGFAYLDAGAPRRPADQDRRLRRARATRGDHSGSRDCGSTPGRCQTARTS